MSDLSYSEVSTEPTRQRSTKVNVTMPRLSPTKAALCQNYPSSDEFFFPPEIWVARRARSSTNETRYDFPARVCETGDEADRPQAMETYQKHSHMG